MSTNYFQTYLRLRVPFKPDGAADTESPTTGRVRPGARANVPVSASTANEQT